MLSCTTAEALGLIVRLDSLSTANGTTVNQNIHRPFGLEDYPQLSCTTGTLPRKYTIKIDPEAKPVVHPVRRQPVALRTKIV